MPFPRSGSLLLSIALSVAGFAQDTLRVQTLTFDSITTRRGWWVFPDSTQTFRKVLMHHTLKCDPLTTHDQYNCGEWDYLTYNMVHYHTGLLDSTALTHPWFKVGAAAPDSAEQTAFVGADIRERWKVAAQVLSVNSATTAIIGQGTSTETVALDFGGGTVRSQYLFPASELSSAGLVAGPINLLRFPLVGHSGTSIARCQPLSLALRKAACR